MCSIDVAVDAYSAGQYPLIRAAATAHSVPYTTLQNRLSGSTSRAAAHIHQQMLSIEEEDALVRYITRLTRTEFPAAPALVLESVYEIRCSRYRISKNITTLPSSLPPVSRRWLDRFRRRHPELRSVWTRQIDSLRYKATSKEAVTKWFNALTEVSAEHPYTPEHIYNMNECRFSVGVTQASKALINIGEKSRWKMISGRQEWITAIECIRASGDALPPLLIFKAKHFHSRWTLIGLPSNWAFTTSNSGWTSDSHGYEWLTSIFDPETRPKTPGTRRLLIMDGHSSHITANVITYCLEKAIDLLILPPHASHRLQPLDVSLFSPLEKTLGVETDKVSQLDSRRMSRDGWTALYAKARINASTREDIESGFAATGYICLCPERVLISCLPTATSSPLSPTTPNNPTPYDLSLLDSSPPDETMSWNKLQLWQIICCRLTPQ